MPERFATETLAYFTKIIIPAVIGVGIKLAVTMRKESTKISFFNVCASMFVGVGGAYLFSDFISQVVDYQYQSIAIGFIAITTEKIAEYLVYQFNIDVFMSASLDLFIDWLSGIRKKK